MSEFDDSQAPAPAPAASLSEQSLNELSARLNAVIHAKAALEETRQQFQESARLDHDRVVADVATRLMTTPEFYEQLATAIVALSKKRQLAKTAQVTEPAKDIVGVLTREVLITDPDDPRLSCVRQIFTTAAFFEFDDYTHELSIRMGLNEEKEVVVVGGQVSYTDVDGKVLQEMLNPECEQGKSLLTSLNASMRTMVENDKALLSDFVDGKKAWFKMYQENYRLQGSIAA